MNIIRVRVAVAALLFVPAVAASQVPMSMPGTTEHLTLDTAVAEALDKNLELIAKRVGITIADANLMTARLRPNPVLSLGGDHLDLLGTGFDRTNTAGPPEYSARIDFLCERGDKRARRTEVKLLMMIFDARDEFRGEPLHEMLVRELEAHNVAGATVVPGITGYGSHRGVHRKGLIGSPHDKPMALIVIENEAKLRAALPILRPMVLEGVFVMVNAEIIPLA